MGLAVVEAKILSGASLKSVRGWSNLLVSISSVRVQMSLSVGWPIQDGRTLQLVS